LAAGGIRVAERSSDRSSPFGSSIKPEDHDGPEAGLKPMKTDKEGWNAGDGLLGSRGDNSFGTGEPAGTRMGPVSPELGKPPSDGDRDE
jgi:hypothetical protein